MTLKCCKKNLELIAHHSAYLHGISIDIYAWWCSCFFPFLQIIVRMCSLFNELCLNMFGSIEFSSIEWLSISLRQCGAEKKPPYAFDDNGFNFLFIIWHRFKSCSFHLRWHWVQIEHSVFFSFFLVQSNFAQNFISFSCLIRHFSSIIHILRWKWCEEKWSMAKMLNS